MRFSYERLRKYPRNFHRIAGVSLEKFEEIALKCGGEWEKRVIKPKKLEGRPYGVGNLKEHLLSLLIYYRCYTTQEFIGMLYGVDDSCICRSIRRIEPILAKVIAIKKDRTLTQKDLETIITDCTEQPIERPTKRQKRYYSGKKKQHTLKTEIQITEGGRIISTSKPHPGRDHDFEVRKQGSPCQETLELMLIVAIKVWVSSTRQQRYLIRNQKMAYSLGKRKSITETSLAFVFALRIK